MVPLPSGQKRSLTSTSRIAMKESDLYPPLKQFLLAQGYEVKGEVQHCDVVAIREPDSPVIVELKRSLSLGVVLQAVERLSMSSQVYIGVPRQGLPARQQRNIKKLLRMLGLGLLIIDPARRQQPVTVLFDPSEYRPRRSKARTARLLGEFTKRVGDPNPGGMDRRRGIMTAYRQRALTIAEYLQDQGPTKAAQVATAVAEPKAREILYRNVYGWFERVTRGVYGLSMRGDREVPTWQPWQDEARVPPDPDSGPEQPGRVAAASRGK